MRSNSVKILLCVLVALAGGLTGAPPALASHGEIDFFEAPQQLIDGNASAAITQLQSLGVHAVRIQVVWYDVAPARKSKHVPAVNLASPSSYDWGQYAPAVAELRRLGWTVLLTVTGYAPCWASHCAKSKDDNHELVTYPSPKYYGEFMEAVAKEFGPDGVQYYSVWNEPNQTQYLLPQYANGRPSSRLVSAAIYRKLYLAAYAGLKASGYGGSAKVLIGETSPVGVSSVDISAPLAFLRGVLCLNGQYVRSRGCAMLHTAGWAQHPYDNAEGPFWRASSGDVTMGSLRRLHLALERAGAAGAIPRGTPIYITEFGVQSYPNKLLGVSPAQQAEYDAIAERTAWNAPYVASFDQYLLTDDPDPGEGSFQTGLEYVNGRQKPIYDGYRLPLSVYVEGGSHVSFWGVVRPASAATTVTVQYSQNNGASWQQLASYNTNAQGYWTAGSRLVAKRVWRVQWTAPDGTVYYGATTRAYAPGNPRPQT
ncbi:MAG TPA: hypothetical protein VL977_02220 [Solirubrobacteraceae bacterium]|nr:hypothetical protein [Solirubrobacteraceae bacterium]